MEPRPGARDAGRDPSSDKASGGRGRKVDGSICRGRRTARASEWYPMHEEERDNRRSPVTGRGDHSSGSDGADASQNPAPPKTLLVYRLLGVRG
jgi:hypothetical protein